MTKELVKALLGRIVAYSPMLARAVGGVTPGLFLSQLIYWSDKGVTPDGMVWKTQAEWEEETALTRREQETARKKLKARGVIIEDNRRLEHRIYYSVDWDKLIELIEASVVTFANGGNVHSGMAESAIGDPHIRHSYLTENTTENTTENITTISIPRWLEILSADPRWPTIKDLPEFIRDIEESYFMLDLTMEAQAAYDWLQEKGFRRTNVKPTWLNWLKGSKKDYNARAVSPLGNGRSSGPPVTGGPDRLEAFRVAERSEVERLLIANEGKYTHIVNSEGEIVYATEKNS